MTLQSPSCVQIKDGAEAAARAGGGDIVLLDANGNVNKQNNDVQDLITRGVTIRTARRVADGETQPPFIDAGTTLVTAENVATFPTTALFVKYCPAIFMERRRGAGAFIPALFARGQRVWVGRCNQDRG